MKNLSIIVPVYNEEKRLEGIREIVQFLKGQDFSGELIVVNDGSTDDTLERLKKLQQADHFSLVTYPLNRGKGYAIKQGMLQARGEYRLFTDVDLSTPLEEFQKMQPFLKQYDVVVGSRKMKGASLTKRQPLLREYLGKGFTLLSQLVLGVRLSDFTCGFKVFSDQATEQIFSRAKIDRWGFDSEVLFLAKKLGLEIKEVPVTWSNDDKTKVKFPQDLINSLLELFIILKNNFQGKYG